ncbi:MAG TPA: tetratricopeptide repeat protein [Rhodanobacteraceae bacterium]|nr:tetratricopeptide repeat protein [Rhodanobacteraceae bacterium]
MSRPRVWMSRLLCALVLGGLIGMVQAATPTLSGDELANNGNFSAAAKAFAVAAGKAPQDASIAASLARAYLRSGDNEQAVEWAQKATALAPAKARYQLLLGDAYSNYVNDVSMFSKLGIAHKIRDAYKQAVALEPKLPAARLSLAMFYLVAPGIAGGSDEDGAAQLRALAALDPAQAAIVRARQAAADKNMKQAESLLRQALDGARDSNALVALGYLLDNQKHYAEALAVFQQAIKAYPAEPTAYYQIGRMAAAGEIDAQLGVAALGQYLGLTIDWRDNDPPLAWAHLRLAQCWARLEQPAKARAELAQARQLKPGFKEADAALAKLPAA